MIEIKFIIMVLCSIAMMTKFHPVMYVNRLIVSIEGGKIVGEEHENFYAFRGIPYAEAPIGGLRFMPPKTYLERWEGLREYKNYSAVCAQYDHFGYDYKGSEDCLTVNVFVPKAIAQSYKKVPVIFFIHGGAFMFGGGNIYGPENIMDSQNMILVTVNYRLGILGFLSTEDEVIPGNFGMKDQVEALRWVQRNIEVFNGDSDKVTIVGFSAGGASVQLHYMSPLTDGLFNNGISHSGVAVNPWVMQKNSKEKAHQIAAYTNCSEDHQQLLTCLRKKPAEDLVMLAKHFQPYLYNPFDAFGVVVESPSETAFLTDHPMNLLKKGNFKKLPWLLSQTQDEGLYPAAEFYDEEILRTINDKWNKFAPFILDFNGTTDDATRKLEVSKEIRKFYLQDQEIKKKTFQPLLQAITDRLYHVGAFKALHLQSAFSPTYFYFFRFRIKAGVALDNNLTHNNTNEKVPLKDFLGVSHGDDVFLIYNNLDSRDNIPYSDEEMVISQNFIALYHEFSKYNTASYGPITIHKVKPKKIKCLEIFSEQNVSMVIKDKEFGHVDFWNSLMINDEQKL